MKNLALAGVLALGLSHAADAATLLTVDLSVAGQITITATDGLSAATVSGGDVTGVYLQNFFSAAAAGFSITDGSGNLTYAGTTSDGTPGVFRANSGTISDPGLNIFSLSDDPLDFTAGQLAFTGSATWVLDEVIYASLLAGPNGGSVFAPADTVDDVADARATLIGEWSRDSAIAAVPLPAGLPLLLMGFTGLAGLRMLKGRTT
ncbi:MAG: hypothetical protein AAF066_01830 [Pseudomonadota bacterium]